MRYLPTSRDAVATITTKDARPPAQRPGGMWLPVLIGMAWAWRRTRWLWLAAILLVSCELAAYRTTPLSTFEPVRWLHEQPGLLGAGLVISSLVALCGLLTAQLERTAQRERLAPYVLRRASTLDVQEYVPRYVPGVYLTRRDADGARDADTLASSALRAAARRKSLLKSDSPLGICVFGRPGAGKTRLAWEALQAELPGWTVVRWPHRPLPALDPRTLGTRRAVLWLDDAHEFANPNDAVLLNDLPRRCAQAGVRLVIIATCRDGADETRACRQLGSVMERLTPIRPSTLSPEEADMLTAALVKQGSPACRTDFTGTPASLVLGLSRMRSDVYPALPEESRRVLAAIKLLRSAGVAAFPIPSVRATAVDVFDLAPSAWSMALGALLHCGFLRLGGVDAHRDILLAPVSKVMLDVAVPEYLTRNGEPSEDWPWLQDALERNRNAEGLLCLGNALSELRTGGGPFLPHDPRVSKQLAVTCFRAALEFTPRNRSAYSWAITQANLGLAIYRQAELATAYLRADLQRQSSAAYRAALEIITRETLPAEWAVIQISLTALYKARAKDSVYAGDVGAACSALREAWRYVENALTVYSLDADPVHYRQCLQLREEVLDAMRELDCNPGGAEDEIE